MHVAQFGSKTAAGFKPIWLAALGALRAEALPTAQTEMIPAGFRDFGVDAWGADRAPAAPSPFTVRGLALCHGKRTQEEWSRELKKFIGHKDWLIGFRGLSCKCGTCSPPIRCCHVCGTDTAVAWFAKRARLRGVAWTGENSTGQRMGATPGEVTMTFEPDTHWMRMTPATWTFGVPQAHTVVPSDACEPPDVTAAAWLCKLPLCQPEPAYRWYRNLPSSWIETYCVGYWSAGQWIQGYIGDANSPTIYGSPTEGDFTIFIEGDTFPLNRWAFTNFSRLTVTICSPAGYECSFSVNTLCGEPQYLLVDPRFGAEMRYCPIHDDACIHVDPDGSFAAIAQTGWPVAVTARTCNALGRLWPGTNVVRISGFRLPRHRFHYSYDIIPQYI